MLPDAAAADDELDADAECDKQLVQQDGTTLCYNLVFAGETWSVATRQCQSRGGSLAVITSDQQNQAVSRLLQDYGRSETWLAANETVHAWQWLDGTYTITSLFRLYGQLNNRQPHKIKSKIQ